ncbi:MAG: site-specific integrase [Prevotellaceae bacterium]|nr:site-specific integrase [Prevotellaceae bacterium]
MATVTAFIRTTKNDKNKSVNVRFRLRDGREFQLFHKSELSVLPDKWDEKQQKIKARCIIDEQQRKDFDKAVSDRKNLIKEIYLQKGQLLTSDILESEIDKVLHPEQYEQPRQTFFEAFDEFLTKHPLSEVRRKNFRVLYRALKRFEMYTQKTERKRRNFILELDTITADTLQTFSDFLKKEHELFHTLPDLYEAFPEYHEQKPRGQNTVNDLQTKFRTFFLWCNKQGKTSNRPFELFKIDESVYGTPFYITIDERNLLYDTNLSHRPALEKQRDIFVFQCLIGCRVGDLYKFTKANIIDGEVNYIAGKTKDGNPRTVKVPLNKYAQEILAKYADYEGKTLFPFISQQNYNEHIKTAFTLAGIIRSVVTCDPLTRENVIRPINEVASSHLARRCFVGNMYKKVKDQNLVAVLSGHKQNSNAFARYRDIDDEMRKELVTMIE